MKKTYIHPQTTTIEMEGTQILAGSDPRIGYRSDKEYLNTDENGYYVGE